MIDYGNTLWMGKPISELTKDELYEVIYHLSMAVANQAKTHRQELEVLAG